MTAGLSAAASPLAVATATTPWSTGTLPWWQGLGGTLVVFALLLICLRLLGRWHARQSHPRAALLSVWPVGPRREIQIVRLEDEVHYIYRHETGLVVLRREALASYQASHPGPARTPLGGWRRLLQRLRGVSVAVTPAFCRPATPAEREDPAG